MSKKYMIFLFLFGSILLCYLGIVVFIRTAPQFGGKFTDAHVHLYDASPWFSKNTFHNMQPTYMNMDAKTGFSVLIEFIKGRKERTPHESLPVRKPNYSIIDSLAPQLTWFGHSTFILQIDGKTFLFDPMFGAKPSPVSFFGTKRFTNTIPDHIEDMPYFDAVIISHDHYDHLDYNTIRKIDSKVASYYMPIGVGRHLERWGVDADKITELDWWDEMYIDSILIACTPARHFSGRGTRDRNTSLWSSWVVKSPSFSFFFSGDTGYGIHFKEIAKKYAPFDFGLFECGQYDERWESIHMLPEQSVQAAIDLQTSIAMPIHWAAFSLSVHSWREPVERFIAKAEETSLLYSVPFIGETFSLQKPHHTSWWIETKE